MLKRLTFTMVLLLLAATAGAGEIRLSAATSLREALDEICASYALDRKEVRFVRNYGASGTLAKQIDNGAPADIFISANSDWLEYLKGKKSLEPASIAILAYNTLVFAGRGDRKAAGMQDLPRLARIAIGSPMSVPAGEYAMTAIRNAGIAPQLEKKLMPARDVREALMYVERGEVDGAFVYRTDALQAKRARILFTVPPQLYPRISYPMALTVAGAKNREAAGFLRFLGSAEARAILVKYGFEVR